MGSHRIVPVRLLALAAALACARQAAASPSFPAAVDAQLMPTKTVEEQFPPSGCLLCHLTTQGGLNSFRPFGALVHEYGASMENVNSLRAALTAIEGASPQLIKDVQDGRDPNEDSSEAPLPTPKYGCDEGGGGGAWPAGVGAALVLLMTRWRRRSAGSVAARRAAGDAVGSQHQ